MYEHESLPSPLARAYGDFVQGSSTSLLTLGHHVECPQGSNRPGITRADHHTGTYCRQAGMVVWLGQKDIFLFVLGMHLK